MLRIIAIIALFLMFCSNYAQKANIYQENIIFTLGSRYLMVNGFYYFVNPHRVNQAMVMQFLLPKNASENDIDSVTVRNYKTEKKIFYTIDSTAIKINFDFEQSDTAIINVRFRHWINNNQFSYSLKPIGDWDVKLRYADFTLFTNKSIIVDSLSIKPDFKAIQPERKIFFWKRDNYIPSENFEVFFRKN